MVGTLLGFAIGALAVGLFGRRRALHAAVLFLLLPLVFAATVMAHEGEDHDSPAVNAVYPTERDAAQRMADGSLFVPKSTQRILAIRTSVVAAAYIGARSSCQDASFQTPTRVACASLGRRTLSPPQGGFPKLGARVNKGDILPMSWPRCNRLTDPTCANVRASLISRSVLLSGASQGSRHWSTKALLHKCNSMRRVLNYKG